MATYTLRVTQNEQTKTARINDNQSVKLAAEPNTEYQIYDEQGNLITHPTVERNGDDLWVYADHKKDGAPELILTNYYNQNPVLDADYVANAGHTLMTSDTVVAAAPILATEIIGKTLMAGAALVIGGTAWAALRDDDDPIPTPAQNTPNNQTPSQDTNNTPADNNQGNNPNNQGSSPTNPTDPNNANNNNNNNQNPTPSNPTPTTQLNPPEITVNPIETVINSQTDRNGTTKISGTFNLNNENLDSETITVSINGGEPMTVPAANINKDQKTWSLDVPNADLIQQNGELPIVAKINIKKGNADASATDNNQANPNSPTPQPTTITVDTSAGKPEITIDDFQDIRKDQANPANDEYIIQGKLNHIDADIDVKDIQISLGLKGLQQNHNPTKQIINEDGSVSTTVNAVSGASLGGNDMIQISADKKSWTASVPKDWVIQNLGENELTATLTVKDKNGNTARAEQPAMDKYTVTENGQPIQTSTLNPPTITIMPTIAPITQANRDGITLLTGRVILNNENLDRSEVKITLGNGKTYTAELSDDKSMWYANVNNQDLIQKQGRDNPISATVIVSRNGETAQATNLDNGLHKNNINQYTVDTQITKPEITIEKIANIDTSNTQAEYKLSGKLNLNNDDVKEHTITLTINGQAITQPIQTNSDKTAWEVMVPKEVLTAKNGQNEVIVGVNVTDHVGNSSSSDAANAQYDVIAPTAPTPTNPVASLNTPYITVAPIKKITDKNGKTLLTGKLDLNNENLDDATVTLIINNQEPALKAEISPDKKSWSLNVDNAVLVGEKDATHTILATVTITKDKQSEINTNVENDQASPNENVANFSVEIAQTPAPTPTPTPSEPNITIDKPTDENALTWLQNNNGTKTISGRLEHLPTDMVQNTLFVSVSVNGTDYPVVTSNNNQWSIQIPAADLTRKGERNITAKLSFQDSSGKVVGLEAKQTFNVTSDLLFPEITMEQPNLSITKANLDGTTTFKGTYNDDGATERTIYVRIGNRDGNQNALNQIVKEFSSQDTTNPVKLNTQDKTWEMTIKNSDLAFKNGDANTLGVEAKITAKNSTTTADGSTTYGYDVNTSSQFKDYMHGNEIILPEGYTKDILKNGSVDEITQVAKSGTTLNTYQSSQTSKNIVIDDLNNLSLEVRKELSLFVAGLLNPIREKWGVGLFKVTQGGIDFAQDIANEYVNNRKGSGDGSGHYVSGITKVAAKYGLNTENNYYENLATGFMGKQATTITLDELKKATYDLVITLLFDDAHSKHDHAKSLLNRMEYEDQNMTVDYLGIDVSYVPNNSATLSDWKPFSIHYISTADHKAYIHDRAKFNETFDTNEITDLSDSSSPLSESAYNDLMNQDNHLMSLLSNIVNVSTDDDKHVSGKDNVPDTFVFSQFLDAGMIAHIDNFNADEDKLQLNQDVFTALSGAMTDFADYVQYDATTGVLSYDADGKGDGAAVQFAQLSKDLELDQSHFIIV